MSYRYLIECGTTLMLLVFFLGFSSFWDSSAYACMEMTQELENTAGDPEDGVDSASSGNAGEIFSEQTAGRQELVFQTPTFNWIASIDIPIRFIGTQFHLTLKMTPITIHNAGAIR